MVSDDETKAEVSIIYCDGYGRPVYVMQKVSSSDGNEIYT
jgi:hypothetical protein